MSSDLSRRLDMLTAAHEMLTAVERMRKLNERAVVLTDRAAEAVREDDTAGALSALCDLRALLSEQLH